MAFVFNSTVGDPAANSYISVSDADDFFSGAFQNDLWTALDTPSKERVLVQSTRRLDSEPYAGRTNTTTQALQFPRDVIFNRNDEAIPNNIIPVNLKNATCELSYFVLQADDRFVSEVELHDAQALTDFEIGPLSYSFNAKSLMNKLPNTVMQELKAIGYDVWLGDGVVTSITR